MIKYFVKHLLVAVTLVAGISVAVAQSSQESANMSRKEKRKLEREQLYLLKKDALENRSFVLESDYLQDRYGYRIPVSSAINFVKIDADEAVIQIGSHSGIGYNGVGGITAKGRITKWELDENERKKTFNLSIHVSTSIGMYEVNMSVGAYGATARLTGIQPGNLTFSGDLVALDDSGVYEGNSI